MFFLFYCYVVHLDLHSFPTRRSSDLHAPGNYSKKGRRRIAECGSSNRNSSFALDRKSTRLNSSHVRISYAVFCLKKKTPLLSNPEMQPYRLFDAVAAYLTATAHEEPD